MKKYLLSTILLVVSSVLLFAQTDEPKNKGLREFHLSSNSPLYIISADDKFFTYPEFSVENSIAIKKTMNSIDPNSIQSIEVFKGKDATDRYGILAKNGAIIIKLKKGTFYKMPAEVKSKFKG